MDDVVNHALLTRQTNAILELIPRAAQLADALHTTIGANRETGDSKLDPEEVSIDGLEVLDWLASLGLTLDEAEGSGDDADPDRFASMMHDEYPDADAGAVAYSLDVAELSLVKDGRAISTMAYQVENAWVMGRA